MGTQIARMAQRSGDAATWATFNPVLRAGELGYDETARKFKVGDGATAWAGLPFLLAGEVAAAQAAASAAESFAAAAAASAASASLSHLLYVFDSTNIADARPSHPGPVYWRTTYSGQPTHAIDGDEVRMIGPSA